MEEGIFNRTELLLGKKATDTIAQKRVILFGVGGVGSWCAESLIRSGIHHLTIVDSDCVCPTNINRQLIATTRTIGRPKVEVLKERLLSINPEAEIQALQKVYCAETADSFHIDTYDYVLDAIDSLENKAHLIRRASDSPATLFASMGAALKMDPLKINIAEFWKVKGCPLAKALRQKFKKSKNFPSKKFKCVYSEELLENKGAETFHETTSPLAENDWHVSKVHTNGTIAHTTAIFGFMLAGLVIQDIIRE
ncbi:MAG: tRNA threonylcarbamoyladenosine dehydratase [Bacteroides sp.]|nr:tRNA threonylcarbamoyladenosine dehydratase [Bacteroides sp.]